MARTQPPEEMAPKQPPEDLSAVFKALGNPHRLAIVRALLARELDCCTGDRTADCALDAASCHVGVLGESLAIDGSTLSHHLKELDRVGLIERARRGRRIYCRINRRRLEELWLVLMPTNVGQFATGGETEVLESAHEIDACVGGERSAAGHTGSSGP